MEIIVFLSLAVGVWSYPRFADKIPNGHNVPHPCDVTEKWPGVGHRKSGGTGARNPFGIDFAKANFQWTPELCRQDSDGDGMLNGEELGDPDCKWSPENNYNILSTDISHPGICEPIRAKKCLEINSWFHCHGTDGGRACASFPPGTENTTLQFKTIHLKPVQTSYFCQIFDLPSDGDYHLIGTTAKIDNSKLAHHMLLFGCDPTADEAELQMIKSYGVYECGMVAHEKCIYLIGTWTYGSTGDCLTPQTGFRTGPRGFRRAALQIHFNNPDKLTNQVDSSGVILHYTRQLRESDAGILTLGQMYLEIPPALPSISFDSTCPSTCTKEMFQSPIYIIRAVNHMHYMGIQQRVSLYRDGQRIHDVAFDTDYHYDSPVFHTFNPPLKVYPGDEFRTSCTYSSKNVNKTVYFGDGTADEMCYSFLTYFPLQQIKVPFCTSWKSVETCLRHLPTFNGVYRGCRWKEFEQFQGEGARELRKVKQACESHLNCTVKCTKAVDSAFEIDPCLQDDLWDFFYSREKNPILGYLKNCTSSSPSDASTMLSNQVILCITILVVIFSFLLNLQHFP